MEMHTWALKYIRTFELLQKSARVDFIQGYQEGRWTGLVDGVPRSIKRRGLSDSVVRFAINWYGAPPLEGKDFAAYRAKVDVETIFGTALVVKLPTGDYMDDKTHQPRYEPIHFSASTRLGAQPGKVVDGTNGSNLAVHGQQ